MQLLRQKQMQAQTLTYREMRMIKACTRHIRELGFVKRSSYFPTYHSQACTETGIACLAVVDALMAKTSNPLLYTWPEINTRLLQLPVNRTSYSFPEDEGEFAFVFREPMVMSQATEAKLRDTINDIYSLRDAIARLDFGHYV